MSQHPAELGLIQQADGADGTEELVQDVPAAANFIDQRWHINRYGTQGYAGAAGQGSLRGVKVFPCFSL